MPSQNNEQYLAYNRMHILCFTVTCRVVYIADDCHHQLEHHRHFVPSHKVAFPLQVLLGVCSSCSYYTSLLLYPKFKYEELALLFTGTKLVMFDHSFLGSDRKCIRLHFVDDYSCNKIVCRGLRYCIICLL